MRFFCCMYAYLVFCLCVGKIGCRSAEMDVNVCDELQETVSRLVHVTDPGQLSPPGPPPLTCSCAFRGTTMLVSTNLLYMYGYEQHAPLSVSFVRQDGTSGVWPTDASVMNLRHSDRIQLASNVTKAEFKFDAKNAGNGHAAFRIDVAVVNMTQDVLTVQCNRTAAVMVPSTTPAPELSFLDNICSPQFLLVLGSCCIGVCLVILMLSVCVCCLMQKRRAKADTTPRERESAIYDTATVRLRASGAPLLLPEPHGNGEGANGVNMRLNRRSNSMPMGGYERKHTSAQYANTTNVGSFRGQAIPEN